MRTTTGGSKAPLDTGIAGDINLAVWAIRQLQTLSGLPAPGKGTVKFLESYGAVGDGTTDNTAAINAAFAALQPGDILRSNSAAGSKTFRHNTVITMPGTTDVIMDLFGVRFTCPNPDTLAFRVDPGAHRLYIGGLTHEGTGYAGITSRSGADFDCAPFAINTNGSPGGVEDLILDRVTAIGSRSASIFLYGVKSALLISPLVRKGWADGIHHTNGTSDVKIYDATVEDVGDDGIAFVGYRTNSAPVRRCDVYRAKVRGTRAGRGISAIGCEDVWYHDVIVSDTYAAGVYIGSENGGTGLSQMHDTYRCGVIGGQVWRANVNAGPDHGSVLLLGGYKTVGLLIKEVDVYHQVVPVRGMFCAKVATGLGSADFVFMDCRIFGTYDANYAENTDTGAAAITTFTRIKYPPCEPGVSDPKKVASAFATTSTSAVDIPRLRWSKVEPGEYLLDAYLLNQTSATGNGPRYAIEAPSGGSVVGVLDMATTTTARSTSLITALNTLQGTNLGVATTNYQTVVHARVVVTTRGDVALRTAVSGSVTGTIAAGSYASLTRVV